MNLTMTVPKQDAAPMIDEQNRFEATHIQPTAIGGVIRFIAIAASIAATLAALNGLYTLIA